MFRGSLILFTGLWLCGCATTPAEPHVQRADGLMVVSSTADVQGLVIKSRESKERICAGRLVEVSDTSGFSLGASDAGEAESIGESSGAITLGGINPAVHMASELMYRACELSLNLNLDDAQSAKIYANMLAAIVSISGHYQTSGSTRSMTSSTSLTNGVKPSVKSNAPEDGDSATNTDSVSETSTDSSNIVSDDDFSG